MYAIRITKHGKSFLGTSPAGVFVRARREEVEVRVQRLEEMTKSRPEWMVESLGPESYEIARVKLAPSGNWVEVLN
ncbi:hypothetical protein AU106_gp104 [Sinorhizobium phage phiM9]|uniref:Uncharacterized protein n=1 Tax=Sinorhizobium phage phiM9 TaxID=1636182 RepID=A0A0F6R5W9_9CAUD|nr:hypothetical protein AU106_gp104 [Sinorhizobium phage phiM9]AKE44735.1 hypothetical protein Sm_phiM9_107 [Sinorhizobium phage phiM9]